MNKIAQGWNVMRILRLGLGIAAIIQGIMFKDIFPAVAGAVLLGTAIFNVGCCSTGNCSTGSCNTPQKNNLK